MLVALRCLSTSVSLDPDTILWYYFCIKKKIAYDMRTSHWSSDVCSSDLLMLDPFHRLLVERDRHLALGRIGDVRGRNQRPVSALERLVDAFPCDPGRALGSGMADLEADARAWGAMNEVVDATPGCDLGVAPQTRAARGDPPFGRKNGRAHG